MGSGSFQCLGNFAPKRWNSESGVPLAATETALTDDGYLWVSAGKAGVKRSKEPFIDLLRQQSIGRLFMERSMWSETGEEGDPIPVDGIIPIPGGLVRTEQGVRILELSGGEVEVVSSIREEHGLVDDYVVSGVFNEKTGLFTSVAIRESQRSTSRLER